MWSRETLKTQRPGPVWALWRAFEPHRQDCDARQLFCAFQLSPRIVIEVIDVL